MANENTQDNVKAEDALEGGLEELGIETSSPEQDAESAEFFSALDRSVMGEVLEDEEPVSVQEPSVTPEPVVAQDTEDSIADIESELATLRKRYSDSSREGKKLSDELNELKPYLPVLNAMREDPNLVSHVKNYFEDGGSAPVSVKEKLGLDEDFVFDYDEAITNPQSDSGKLFNSTVDGVVQRRLSEFANKQAEETRKLAEESSFKTRNNMSEDDYADMMNFAKNHTLTLDDISYLKNRADREKNIANSAREETVSQMKNVRQRPASLGNVGGGVPEVEESVDDQVFNRIMGSGGAELMFE
tara:strand:+ start:2266 stop:3171 length:906 start_codon:yes stop_codon:yes gene_type:complete